MRTLVLLTQYFTPEIGAPQTRLWETAKGLQKKGWKIIVVTGMPNYPSGKIANNYKRKISVTEDIDAITIKRYWLYASNSKQILPRIINMLSFALMALLSVFYVRKLKPQFIITESPPLALGFSGLILAKCSGAKHILNVSDLWPLSAFELGALQKGTLYHLLEKFEKWLYRQSYACIGQSNEIIEAVNRKGALKYQLYRNGVTRMRFTPNQLIPQQNQPFKIVYTGLLGVAQGILNICEHIPFAQYNCEFHIYGDGAEKNSVEELISKNQRKDIVYHGKIPSEHIPEILTHYHLTLIPLIKPIYGAIPSKIYESMAAGLPILFAGGGEGAMLIKEHRTGWICNPSDFTSMKSILQQLSSLKEDEWQELKSNCVSASMVFDRSTQIDNLNLFLVQCM